MQACIIFLTTIVQMWSISCLYFHNRPTKGGLYVGHMLEGSVFYGAVLIRGKIKLWFSLVKKLI